MEKSDAIVIKLELGSLDELQNFFEIGKVEENIKKDLFDGQASVVVNTVEEGPGFLDSISVELILNIAGTISTGLLTNALYDVLKKSIKSIYVNKRKVRPYSEDIEKAVEFERSEKKD